MRQLRLKSDVFFGGLRDVRGLRSLSLWLAGTRDQERNSIRPTPPDCRRTSPVR